MIKKLGEEENKLIQKKYASQRLGDLSETELMIASAKLVLKIHVIIGWVVPDGDFQDELVNQFSLKIKEDYPNMNADEIEYAFRQNTSVQDWGKVMNLQMIDSILIPYLEKRADASKMEEQIKSVPVTQKIYSDEEIFNQRREEIEHAFQAMKKGYYPLLHSYFKEVLEADGLLNKTETLGDFFVRKLGTNAENIYKKG